MSGFRCTPCSYETKNKSNYNKHLQSNKHQQKSITAPVSTFHKHLTASHNTKVLTYKCQDCNAEYSRQSALTKHINTCTEKKMEIQRLENEKQMEIQKVESEKQIEIEKLKTELEYSKKQLTNQEKQLTNQEKKINSLENFIKTLKTTPTYNISIKKLVQTSYSNAPPLTQLDNYEIIHDKQFVDFVDEIISYNDQKILYKYIGDIIVKYYKKDNPEDQSMWNTDVSRLNYIIKEAMTNNKSKWIDDVNANRIKESIIQPLLQYIKSHIIKEHKAIHKEMKKATAMRCIDLTQKINSLAEIQYEITNGTLEDDIVKYISPSFRHLIEN